ncbi:class I SAM-dependent RNA methyltransferase [Fibrobacterota bacterium]
MKIEKLIPGGDGLSHIKGKAVLIPYVIPGETVSVKTINIKKEYVKAEPVHILKPSSFRKKPECDYFTFCGGCSWMHMNYSEQLQQKVAVFQEAMQRTGKIELPHPDIVSGNSLRYRNRVQFQADSHGNLGFMRRGSNTIITVNACPVLHKSLESLIDPKNTQLEKWYKNSCFTGQKKIPAYASSTWVAHPGSPDPLGSSGDLWEDILGKHIFFNLDCFFQSNSKLLPEFVRYAVEGQKGVIAMDLYCGVGLFGAFLGEHFDQLIAVEQNKTAVKYARKNLKSSNCRIFNEKVENLDSNSFKGPVQLILVNPPRTGLTKAARKFILQLAPDNMTYISCHPVTLARDLRGFMDSGYQVTDFRLFDFFPQTAYVESIVKMKRKS